MGIAHAQTQTQSQQHPQPQPRPAETDLAKDALIPLATPKDVAPFDPYLEEIMQKLGSLSHLSALCSPEKETSKPHPHRAFASRILSTMNRSEVRKQRFLEHFNDNFAAAALTHIYCTPTAKTLTKAYEERVKTLAKTIKLRYENDN